MFKLIENFDAKIVWSCLHFHGRNANGRPRWHPNIIHICTLILNNKWWLSLCIIYQNNSWIVIFNMSWMIFLIIYYLIENFDAEFVACNSYLNSISPKYEFWRSNIHVAQRLTLVRFSKIFWGQGSKRQ